DLCWWPPRPASLARRESREPAGLVDAFEQQMEVGQAGVGRPSRHRPGDAVVVQRPGQAQASGQVVSGADVVAGKYVEPTEAAQKGVLRRPPPDAAELLERARGVVVVLVQ